MGEPTLPDEDDHKDDSFYAQNVPCQNPEAPGKFIP
jgi:hypothetical protein